MVNLTFMYVYITHITARAGNVHGCWCFCVSSLKRANSVQAHCAITQALLDLGATPSQVQPALEAIAVMGCKYSGEMLKTDWRRLANVSVPSPDAPNSAALHLQNLLSGTARRPSQCLQHMALRRPSSRITGVAARGPAWQFSAQHGPARKRQRSPDYGNPPKRARVDASHLSLSTIASLPTSD